MSTRSYLSSCSPLASAPPNYEDDGADGYAKPDGFNFVGEEQPVSPPLPVAAAVKAKRQRQAVIDSEDNDDERQRKRRKTDFTQSTLVNPTQYNPFRDSPLSKTAAPEHVASQGLVTPTRLRLIDFSKHISTKRTAVRPLPVMDFTARRVNRRESIAQRVADQTFVLENEEEEEEEEPEVAIPTKGEGLRLSRLHQEEEFGEVAELQAQLKRQRKGKLNPDLIPALTYQSEIPSFHMLLLSFIFLCQWFEPAQRLGLNPELKPLSAMPVLTHVLRHVILAELVLDGEVTRSTEQILSNINGLDYCFICGLLDRSDCRR